MTDSPRAYTSDEMRDIFIAAVRDAAAYWASLPETDKATGREMSIRNRCDGVAFSILSLMDGSTLNMPPVDLVFRPHEDDKDYRLFGLACGTTLDPGMGFVTA